MNTVLKRMENEEDCVVCQAFVGILMAPLYLLMTLGTLMVVI